MCVKRLCAQRRLVMPPETRRRNREQLAVLQTLADSGVLERDHGE